MSLADVAAYLAAGAAARPGLLDRHLEGLAAHLHDARAVAHALRNGHERTEPPMTSVTVAAGDLADAIDQVLPAASRDPELPVLGCVLIEARQGSLRLVATDRFRLAVRDLVVDAGDRVDFRALVPAATLRRWRPDLPSSGVVTVAAAGGDLAVRGDGGDGVDFGCPLVPAEFPAYEAVLAREGGAAAVVVGRDALHAGLRRFAEPAGEGAVLVRAGAGGVALVRRDVEVVVPSGYAGPPADVALDPGFAADAVAATTGPDVVLEVVDPLRPVVFRSADDGTFTTLLMPVRLDG
jgi:DNA polymerase III sliding clamp (beta) subunit (PCNA family)